MSEITGVLRELGLISINEIEQYIFSNPIEVIDSLVVYLREIIEKEYVVQQYNLFTFIPNGDISGTGGCDEISCKLKRISNYSVFSALYADKTYIQLEFITSDKYDISSWIVQHEEFEEVEDIELNYRLAVERDLNILNAYSELIEAGIVNITPPQEMMCPHCFQEKILGSRYVLDFEKIAKQYCRRAEVVLKDFDDNDCTAQIEIHNMQEFFPDHELFWTISNVDEVKMLSKEKIGKKIQNKEYSKKFISRFVIEEIINACYLMKYCGEQKGKLITNKMSDSIFFGANKNIGNLRQIENYNTLLPEYDLPFIKGLSIKNILRLREEEKESFDKYRLALLKAISEQNTTNRQTDWLQIYEDIIYPELNNLDLKMKQIKNGRLSRIFGTMAVVGTCIVANKFGNLVYPNMSGIWESVQTAVMSAGVNYTLDKISIQKANLQENDYYFLWKLKQRNKMP